MRGMFCAGLASITIGTVSAEDSDELNYSWVEGVAIFISVLIVAII